jgi:uncharacterized protein YjbK
MKNFTDTQHQAMSSLKENQAIGRMEYNYLQHKRNTIYIALEEVEDADFYWSPKEIEKFDILWKKKTPITEIATAMRRTEVAVFLLSLDRVFRGINKPRRGWKIW